MPQMSSVSKRSAASPGAKLPFASSTDATSALPTGKKMKMSSSAPMTTTIVAIVGSPLNAPERASVRARTTVKSESATAAPNPHDGPWVPAMKPSAKPQATPIAAAIDVARSRPIHARTSIAIAATTSGPSDHAAANAGHFGCVPDSAHESADGVPPSPHGANASASSATAAISGVVRSREVGVNVADARGGAVAGVAIV